MDREERFSQHHQSCCTPDAIAYPMHPFRCMVTAGHNSRVLVRNWRPTEQAGTVKMRLEGHIQCDAWYWCRAQSNPPQGCLWLFWRSASTLSQPLRPDGNVFYWCCSHLRISHRISARFHQQRDGQIERENQTTEQHLQAFGNYEQDNWVESSLLAQFAFNYSIHNSTLMTPFWANYDYHPTVQFKPLKDPSFRSQVQADSWIAGMEETHRILRENIIEAQERQTQYAGGTVKTSAVGDKVWLLTWNLKTSGPSKKLDYKCTGPYTVCNIIYKFAYKQDIRSTMQNDNVFQVTLLHCYAPPVRGWPSSEPHLVIFQETEEWDVDQTLDSWWHYRKPRHLMQWAGYNNIRTIWEPAEHLGTARDLVDEFHGEHLLRPWE